MTLYISNSIQEMSSRKLTVLVTPLDGVGHYNGSIGVAEQLLNRGHKVIFAVQDGWRHKLKALGFEEEWYNPDIGGPVSNNADTWDSIISKMGAAFLMNPKDQIRGYFFEMYEEAIRQVQEGDPKLKRIIEKVKPDIILGDLFFHQPAVMDAGIPWVLLVSAAALCISDENCPPCGSGYPSGLEHKQLWDDYKMEYELVMKPQFEDFNKWVIKRGGPTDLKFRASPGLNVKFSPYANLYMCPEELDYTKFRPNPPNFHRFDTFVRDTEESFEIPEMLKNKPGKLIYFSMGTLDCSELGMMRRLISILAKSPHRFIVSKGIKADQLELADNMWGAKYVPQTRVIPLVDFVISHGGNNTVTESFYFGKPLIILPLFGDQPDNAQRVSEEGLGIRLHSHNVTEEELLTAIEKMARDKQLADRMATISKRIQASNSQVRAAEFVEQMVFNNKI